MIPAKATTRYWSQRLHKASYTRNGKRQTVSHWSIKIQHHGIRRSMSLATGSRSIAAKRALQLYQAVLEQGWHAADEFIRQFQGISSTLPNKPPAEGKGTRTTGYWKQRLSKRSYLDLAGLTHSDQWSVRIDRSGVNDYFPTESTTIDQAIRFATKLNARISQAGWRVACREFAREFTIAIFWSVDPITCTYATMVSLVQRTLKSSLPDRSLQRKILLVEPRDEIAETIAYWLSQTPGFTVSRIAPDLASATQRIQEQSWDLVLINRQSFNPSALNDQLQRINPAPPPAFVGYGLYVDSNEIFRSVSGVDRGYFLRRRSPDRILAPIASQSFELPLASTLPITVKTYFQNLFTEMAHSETPSHLNLLTRRELEILEHLSAGYLDKEIAVRLQISNWTVRNHLKRIYSKLGIHNRTEAVIQYLQK